MRISSLRLSAFDPAEFLRKLGKNEREPVLLQCGRFTVIGWNPSERIRTDDAEEARAKLNTLAAKRRVRYDGPLPFVGGLIGYASADLGCSLLRIKPTAADRFHLPFVNVGSYDEVILSDGDRVFVVGSKAFEAEVLKVHARPLSPSRFSPLRFRSSVTRVEYAKRFQEIKRLIHEGDVYQLNSTFTFDARSSADPTQVFSDLYHAHPAPCAAYLDAGDCRLLSLSPERFVTVEGSQIATFPVKGTRPRGLTEAKDEQLRAELLKSEKEAAELNMITDLLRNDLGKIARIGSVRVSEHRRVDPTPSVWHTSSIIEAELAPDVSPIDALFSMLPAGSVTGCPKKQACIEIDRLEGVRRGPYTGVIFAQSDHGCFTSSVVIRTLVHQKKTFSLGVGGGIVDDSKLADEWRETQHKAAPFLRMQKTKENNVILRKIWINGASAKRSDPRVVLLDPSNEDARGVFETMRTKDGAIHLLTAHLERLASSAKLLKMRLPRSIDAIASDLRKVARSGDAPSRVKIVATDRDILIAMEPLAVDRCQDDGIAATCIRCDRALPAAKALPYHKEWRAHAQARSRGFGEALLVDRSGHVPEAAYGNLFWVEDRTLFTAAAGMLAGITRAEVLALARKHRIRVKFASPTQKRLFAADEVFLTKSLSGITPIVRIDRNVIGGGRTGAVTQFFMKWLSIAP